MGYLEFRGLRGLSHKMRHHTNLNLVQKHLVEDLPILDYGCGDGRLLADVTDVPESFGYEPYMDANLDSNQISRDLDTLSHRSYGLILLFEVFEHLTPSGEQQFLDFAKRCLHPKGRLVMSVPIEYGPVWLIKYFLREASRLRLRGWQRKCADKDPRLSFSQIFKCGILGECPPRTLHRNMSHLGFDARKAVASIEAEGWTVIDSFYGPFPLLSCCCPQLFTVFAPRKD